MPVQKERKVRSIARVISWRLTATFTTILISYFITGNTQLALEIGAIEVVAKIALQYVHDRLWISIPFGLSKPMDYHI